MDIERDKVTVIQSVLLMSHRYADTEDRSGPWHWIGVAITLSHTVGLHRNSGLGNSTRLDYPYFDRQMFTWRRIWWSCFYRQTWLSLSHGRPMRTHLDDYDMPMPLPEDMWTGTAKLPADLRQKYLPRPQDCEALSPIHLANLKLSVILAKIIRAHYGPRQAISTVPQIKAVEDMIVQYSRLCQDHCDHPNPLIYNRASHVLIYYEYGNITISILIRLGHAYLDRSGF